MTFRAPLGIRLQPTDATAAVTAQVPGSPSLLTALPFLLGQPRDFPNPRGAAALIQPIVTRRPSVAPTPFSQPDWPNPWSPGRAGPDVLQRSTALLASVSAVPFNQDDYPNPRGAGPLTVEFWSRPSPALQIGLNPFRSTDFPNPRGPQGLLQDHWLRFSLVTQVSSSAPFAQTDWPNPVRAAGGLLPDQWPEASPTRQISLNPFIPIDAQNPRGPAPPPQDFLSRPASSLNLGQGPLTVVDYPNPRGPPPSLQDHTLRPALALQINISPFRPVDAPNPRGSTPVVQDFWQRSSPALQIGLNPFAQRDHPNPRAPGQPTADFALPNTTLGMPIPPIVLRPPLVQAIWRVDPMAAITAQFTGTRLPIVTPPGIPFIPVDYPNPRGPLPLLQAFVSSPAAAQQITLKPFLQTDYPNPPGARPIPQSMWQSIPPTLLPVFKPFFQSDYPNPRAAAPLVLDIGRPNIIVSVLPVITILRPPSVFRSWRVDSVVAINAQSWLQRLPNPSQPIVRSAIGAAFGAGSAVAIGSSLNSPFFNEYAAYVYQFPNTAIRFASYDPVSRLLWVQFFSGLAVVVPNVSVGTASSIQSAANGEAFVLALARTVNPNAA